MKQTLQTIGGINPSENSRAKTPLPYKGVTHRTATISNWRAVVALDSPKEKQQNIKAFTTIYKADSKIQPPVEDMQRSFNNYEAYKRDLQPRASKLEYRRFLSAMQTSKRAYDSNISNALEHNRRVIAYKNKEQNLRHGALKVNVGHKTVQKKAMQSIEVK